MYRYFLHFFFILVPAWTSVVLAEETGLKVSISGDMVYTQGLNRESARGDKLTMRGGELRFYSPVDSRFDALLSAVVHEERGKMNFELHELFLSSSKLVPKSVIKVGQFFFSIGRLNRFHQHDWPFTDAPKVHRTFFAKEAIFDAGLEYNLLFPFEKLTAHLSAGFSSGYRYGHSHTEGAKPLAPTHYLRPSIFFPIGSTSGVDVGLNYLGRTDAQKNKMDLLGVDLLAKWRGMRKNKWLFQSELWYKREEDRQGDVTREVGFYGFNEFPISEMMNMGFRLDIYKELSRFNALSNKKVNNISYGVTLQSTFVSSEFSKFRTTLSHEFERVEGRTGEKDTKLGVQFVFIMGSHPAHDF